LTDFAVRSDLADGAAAVDRQSNPAFDITHLSLRYWLTVGVSIALLVLASYRWVDRPTATLMHGAVRPGAPLAFMFNMLTHLPDLLTTVGVGLILLLPLLGWLAHASGRYIYVRAALLVGASFVLSSSIKTILKWGFGRTWPETWVRNNPSFVHDGVFQFSPFHGGAGWSAFPSGHMSAVVSVAMMGWHLWPRLAPLWIVTIIGTGLGLIGLNLHFVSDVLAGGYIGAASVAAVLWFAAHWSNRITTASD